MNIKKYIGTGLALVLVGGMAVATPAFADRFKPDIGVLMQYDLNEGRGEKEKVNIVDMKRNSTTTPIIQGNGQTIVGGTITAIASTTVTIKNSGNVVYTVNATNAKIVQGKKISTLANLAVGSQVIVQGSVNGTSIVATSIISSAKPIKIGDNATTSIKSMHKGFFGGMGYFFARIFGF